MPSQGRVAMPARNSSANDNVLTPQKPALQIVKHFGPTGDICDPCAGDGAFVEAIRTNVGYMPCWCEIRKGARYYTGTDFYQLQGHWDYLISNPPYSHLTEWLEKSFTLADNVIYLVQATAPEFTSRRRAAHTAGFGIKEKLYVRCPDEWRESKLSFGAGLAAVHWQRGWNSGVKESYLGHPMYVLGEGKAKKQQP